MKIVNVSMILILIRIVNFDVHIYVKLSCKTQCVRGLKDKNFKRNVIVIIKRRGTSKRGEERVIIKHLRIASSH